MPLAKHYRFQVKNDTGETVTTSDLRVIRKKFSAGALLFEGSLAELLGSGGDSISTASVGNGAAQDNSSPGYTGLDGEFEVNVASGSPAGNVHLYYQVSPNGSDWPDDEEGVPVAAFNFQATGTQTTPVSL